MLTKLILPAVYGISMAHLEDVDVVYLRPAPGMYDSVSNKDPIDVLFLFPQLWFTLV